MNIDEFLKQSNPVFRAMEAYVDTTKETTDLVASMTKSYCPPMQISGFKPASDNTYSTPEMTEYYCNQMEMFGLSDWVIYETPQFCEKMQAPGIYPDKPKLN